MSFTECLSVTETAVISQDASFTDICQTVGTFSASRSIKTPLQHFYVGVVCRRKKKHYLIKSSNSDSGDRFSPPERQQSKVSLLRIFHFSFQRATLPSASAFILQRCRNSITLVCLSYISYLSLEGSLVFQAFVGAELKHLTRIVRHSKINYI